MLPRSLLFKTDGLSYLLLFYIKKILGRDIGSCLGERLNALRICNKYTQVRSHEWQHWHCRVSAFPIKLESLSFNGII